MLVASPTIYPIDDTELNELEDKWIQYHTHILDTIMSQGQFEPPYVHNRLTRGVQLFNSLWCCIIYCLPCCVCDMTNACLYACCKCEIKHPCNHCFVSMCEKTAVEIYRRKDQKEIDYLRTNASKLPVSTIQKMCDTYLIKFDECVLQRTPHMAKRANAIREQLVVIILTYVRKHSEYVDTGDIDNIRQIVRQLV